MGAVVGIPSKAVIVCALGIFGSGCTSVNLLHDPQFITLPRDEIPDFLKSVRCELITFYTANAARQQYASLSKASPERKPVFFDLSDRLYGPVVLDLKVVDALGMPGASTVSSLDYKHVLNATHSLAWHLAPVANTQNTYELIYNFLIRQDARLFKVGDRDDDEIMCYKKNYLETAYPLDFREVVKLGSPPKPKTVISINREDIEVLDRLAHGYYSDAERFRRITVAGTNASPAPLAAWLLENNKALWMNSIASHSEEEARALIAGQENFTFTVQFTGGLEARYTLTGPIPSAAADFNINAQQSSMISFGLNGPEAVFTSAAKLGGAGICKKLNDRGSDPSKCKDFKEFIKSGSPPQKSRGYLIEPFAIPLPQ